MDLKNKGVSRVKGRPKEEVSHEIRRPILIHENGLNNRLASNVGSICDTNLV